MKIIERVDQIREILRGLELRLDETSYELEEGGVHVGFSTKDGAREVAFVLPADASVTYFIGRRFCGAGIYRRAGIVRDDAAIAALARWAAAEDVFPTTGLEVGDVP